MQGEKQLQTHPSIEIEEFYLSHVFGRALTRQAARCSLCLDEKIKPFSAPGIF